MSSVKAADGYVRVYSVPVVYNGAAFAVVQVARSTLPEQQSLDKLLIRAADRRRRQHPGGGHRRLVSRRQGARAGARGLRSPARLRGRRIARAAHPAGRDPGQRRVPADHPARVGRDRRHRQRNRPACRPWSTRCSALARGGRGDRAQPDVFDLGSVVEQSVEAMAALATDKSDRPARGRRAPACTSRATANRSASWWSSWWTTRCATRRVRGSVAVIVAKAAERGRARGARHRHRHTP